MIEQEALFEYFFFDLTKSILLALAYNSLFFFLKKLLLEYS